VCVGAKVKEGGPGGVAQCTSHPPLQQKTRVRIPLGYKILMENIAMLLRTIELMHCFCVEKEKIIGPKMFFF
jgi:hypothetical protein